MTDLVFVTSFILLKSRNIREKNYIIRKSKASQKAQFPDNLNTMYSFFSCQPFSSSFFWRRKKKYGFIFLSEETSFATKQTKLPSKSLKNCASCDAVDFFLFFLKRYFCGKVENKQIFENEK